jgi:thiol-disulfide isomerase/thioredoxin
MAHHKRSRTMMSVWRGVALSVFLLAWGTAMAQKTEKPASVYVAVDRFDSTRDAARDIREAMVEAKSSGRRILLDVGGGWCIWCHRLDAFFGEEQDLADDMHKHFVVVKVFYSREYKNEAVLSQYPKIPVSSSLCTGKRRDLVVFPGYREAGIGEGVRPGQSPALPAPVGRRRAAEVNSRKYGGEQPRCGKCYTRTLREVHNLTREGCMKAVQHGLILVLLGVLLVVPARAADPAPNFVLQSQDGKMIELKKLAGKAVVVNFWATWCGPCRAEIPGMMKVYEKYKSKGLEIVGISLDRGGWDDVKPYLAKNRISYPVVVAGQELADAYGGIQGIPTTFFVDRKGNIVSRQVGALSEEAFEKAVKGIL